jgi:acyl transferase domain-containing protein
LDEWRVPAGKRRLAAVSSFGFSGTNCHLVLEEAPERFRHTARRRPWQLALISGRTQEALRQRFSDLAVWLDNHPDLCLEDVVYTLQVGRTHLPGRAALLVADIEDLRCKLGALAEGKAVEACILADHAHLTSSQMARSKDVPQLLESLRQPSDEETQRQDLHDLARLYVERQAVDWRHLYEANEGRRVPLPGYPFARERYWVKSRAVEVSESQIEVLHPLLDRNVSTLYEQRFTKRLQGDAFFLSDHIVNGSKVLPGACYLEMARVAAELSLNEPVWCFRDVAWLKPAALNDDPLDLQIALFAEDEAIEFEITSTHDDEPCIHAQGRVIRGDVRPRSAQLLDFSAIRARCQQQLAIDDCYQDAKARGLFYGPSYQVLRQLHGGAGEAWAELALAPHLNGRRDFILHPSLLDGALQTLMGVQRMTTGTHVLYLPFTVSEIEIIERLPERCFSYVKSQGEVEHGVGRFDLWILDEKGRVLVALKDYRVKALSSPVEKALDDESLLALFEGLRRGEVELDEAEQRVEVGGSA